MHPTITKLCPYSPNIFSGLSLGWLRVLSNALRVVVVSVLSHICTLNARCNSALRSAPQGRSPWRGRPPNPNFFKDTREAPFIPGWFMLAEDGKVFITLESDCRLNWTGHRDKDACGQTKTLDVDDDIECDNVWLVWGSGGQINANLSNSPHSLHSFLSGHPFYYHYLERLPTVCPDVNSSSRNEWLSFS